MLATFSPGALSFPVHVNATDITSWQSPANVSIDSTYGLSFKVVDEEGAGVSGHHCSIMFYRWMDNESYPLRSYSLTEACRAESFALSGVGDTIPVACYLVTSPSGLFAFSLDVSRAYGFHVAPDTGAYVGGYGTYKVEAQCGNTADLVQSANFTVTIAEEPTWMVDMVRFVTQNPAYIAFAIFLLVAGAVLLYILLKLVGVYQ